MNAYQLSGIKQNYADRRVLDIDQLNLEAGKVYGLSGANGAGKTTLLTLLAFLEAPTAGCLSFFEKPVALTAKNRQRLRQQVVLVEQDPVLFSTSVEKNIEFGLKVRRLGVSQRAYLVDEALTLVGMRDFKKARATCLSGGEAQRIALARAFVLAPRVLLCDEPTTGLDPCHQAAIKTTLLCLNQEKKMTLLLSSHDQVWLDGLATETIRLEAGQLAVQPDENLLACIVTPLASGQLRCQVNAEVIIDLSPPVGFTTVRRAAHLLLPAAQLQLSRAMKAARPTGGGGGCEHCPSWVYRAVVGSRGLGSDYC